MKRNNKKSYIYTEEKEGINFISLQCEKCYLENNQGYCWMYGYPEQKIICSKCGELIYEVINKKTRML